MPHLTLPAPASHPTSPPSHTRPPACLTQPNLTELTLPMQMAASALQALDEELPTITFQLLVELMENPTPLVQPHMAAIMELVMAVACSTQVR